MRFYNFLARKKEIFKPLLPGRVGLYTCGPTVYYFAHIGNLRTYIFEDVLRRTLEYAGYRVRQVMNITDVDDKIIRDAKGAHKTIFEFVKPYEQAFFEDLKKLNILPAWKYPKATDHMPEMIALTTKLLKNKMAYALDGSVYFDISKFKPYGRLSRLGGMTLKKGVRVDADEYAKEDIRDFALWKKKKEDEPSWSAPFGEGHPGWHLECSAMSLKYLGQPFDIHAGAVDLLFPHHENEIAQSEGAAGKPFARFFVEGEHLLVNGEKMSKSLGNIFTLRDIETRTFDPLAFRYLTLTTHYRSKLNFTWESLTAAENSMQRLYEFVKKVQDNFSTPPAARGTRSKSTHRAQSRIYLPHHKEKFGKALFDDLDTPKALAVLWEFIHDYHKKPSSYDCRSVLTLLYECDAVLGLGLKELKREKAPVAIMELVNKREHARKTKNWAEADRLREELKTKHWIVEDTPTGPFLTKLPKSDFGNLTSPHPYR